MLEIQKKLDAGVGLSPAGDPNTGLVFTDDGYRVLNVGDIDNKEFVSRLKSVDLPPGQKMRRHGIYSDLDWAGGNATRDMLKAVDNPLFPGAARHADSPETRKIMGELSNHYSKLQSEGKLKPNQKLVDVLNTWKSSGLTGVREMVRLGLAPAVVLGAFGSLPDAQRGRPEL